MRWLKQNIRQHIREKRRQIPLAEQQHAARRVAQQLCLLTEFHKAQHIALYMSLKEELSTQYILQLAVKQLKSCYLPVVTHTQQLQFYKVSHESKLQKNHFGIFEPLANTQPIAASELDLVLLPLVAFDSAMHRMGMGGGYYDRTFAFKRRAHKPILLGIGYEIQKVNCLPHSNLDVSLDMVLTERKCYTKRSYKPPDNIQ